MLLAQKKDYPFFNRCSTTFGIDYLYTHLINDKYQLYIQRKE